MNKILLYVFLLSIFVSCNHGVDVSGLSEYIKNESNGLRISGKSNEYTTIVQYKPKTYVALVNTDGKVTEDFQAMIEGMEGLQYYNLEIGLPHNGKGLDGLLDEKELSENELQHYLSFRMQFDLFLIDGRDTLPCIEYLHESNMGFRPYDTFLLTFKDKGLNMDRTLLWNSKILLDEPVSITIKAEDINNIPQLKR